MLSAILYCSYSDGFFEVLRKRINGCWLFNQYAVIVGYADDNWLLYSSGAALQSMIKTCEEYVNEHNLTFSTNIDPIKSKTKCMVFLKTVRMIEPLRLNNMVLPFTSEAKHLGHFFTNNPSAIKHDMKVKRAMNIQKNCDLIQEFGFCHPKTKLKLNEIYNSSYTGCQLWDLFCDEAEKLENSYNTSVRIMMGIPRNTHRYLIQPLTESRHLKQSLVLRFLNFCEKLSKCKKEVVRTVFGKLKFNVRSTTGSNLKEISLLVNKRVEDLSPKEASDIQYHQVRNEDKFRVGFVWEILNVKHGQLEVSGFTETELEMMPENLCTS